MQGLVAMRIQRQRRDERERLSGSKARRTGRSMLTTPARRPSCRRSAPSLVGRWPNRDPLNELGGVNLYAFVHNNPVDFVDTDGQQIYPPYNPPPKPQPLPPPASGQCRIEVCCKPVATFGSAHCVIRFTGSDGSVSGCRGGPTGTGNSSGAGGSSGSSGSGAGNRPSAHCKGCCGKWGNIVAGCGKGTQGSSDPLELGLWSDLDEAKKNPGQCSLIEESAAACGVEACVAREMQNSRPDATSTARPDRIATPRGIRHSRLAGTSSIHPVCSLVELTTSRKRKHARTERGNDVFAPSDNSALDCRRDRLFI